MTGPTPQYLENLIASQKAEIERLTRERSLQDKVVADCVARVTERDAEIVRLTAALKVAQIVLGRQGDGPSSMIDCVDAHSIISAALDTGTG